MEIITKCTVAAVFGAVVCLLIKKNNPEHSFAFGTLLTVSILLAVSVMFSSVMELVIFARDMIGSASELIKPLVKCLAIGFISKFGTDVCKDASQTALASALELGGTLCAAGTAIPLIIRTLTMIGTMV